MAQGAELRTGCPPHPLLTSLSNVPPASLVLQLCWVGRLRRASRGVRSVTVVLSALGARTLLLDRKEWGTPPALLTTREPPARVGALGSLTLSAVRFALQKNKKTLCL